MPASEIYRPKRKNRVTIEEMGARLHVSTSTVSRALRHDSLIHPETRSRVNALAIEMGYQGRSRQAANRGGKKFSLAVLFSSASLAQVRSSYITTCYLQGLTTEAESAGIALNLHTVVSTSQPDFEKTAGIPRSLWLEDRDAVIVTGLHHEETVARLAEKTAVVSLVWDYANTSHDLVNTADMAGMDAIVHALVRLGHRRLAWAGGIPGGSVHDSRQGGFIHGCLERGLSLEEQFFVGFPLVAEVPQVEPPDLLDVYRRGATAFVCSSDHCAHLVMEALRSVGVRVPADVSVTGFNHSLGTDAEGHQALTTIDPQFVEMGRTAVRLAKWRSEQPSSFPATLSLRPRLITGMSTGPVPPNRPAR